MKKIEITTTQNVTIEYGLAALGHRMVAFLIDQISLWVVVWILAAIEVTISPKAYLIMWYFTIAPLLFFYTFAFEYFNNGQTLGKMALKIRVIKKTGEKTTFLDFALRWVFRMIDIYGTLGSVASLGILSSTNNQRLGDILANTVVIKVAKNERMTLNTLLNLNKIKNYTPKFPEVVNMKEEAMLTLKETVQRYKNHKNFAHNTAVDLLVKKMEKELSIGQKGDKILFLEQLLKDYVVLTR